MKCPWLNPYQMSLKFCLMNPSIILPTARTFRVAAYLGPRLGFSVRFLAEKISFQEAFKKRSNFTSILTSIFVPSSILERPGVDFGTLDRPKTLPRRPTSIKNRSKLDPKMQELSRKRNQEQSLTHDYQKRETEWRRPPKFLLNHKTPKKNVGRR